MYVLENMSSSFILLQLVLNNQINSGKVNEPLNEQNVSNNFMRVASVLTNIWGWQGKYGIETAK